MKKINYKGENMEISIKISDTAIMEVEGNIRKSVWTEKRKGEKGKSDGGAWQWCLLKYIK